MNRQFLTSAKALLGLMLFGIAYVAAAETATIKGKFLYDGDPPAPRSWIARRSRSVARSRCSINRWWWGKTKSWRMFLSTSARRACPCHRS